MLHDIYETQQIRGNNIRLSLLNPEISTFDNIDFQLDKEDQVGYQKGPLRVFQSDGLSLASETLQRAYIDILEEYTVSTGYNWGKTLCISHAYPVGEEFCLFPDVEYPVALSVAPKRQFLLKGKLRRVERPTGELNLAESEWSGVFLE